MPPVYISSRDPEDLHSVRGLLGNRKTALDLDGVTMIGHVPNELNQYVAIGAVVPVHDADGNMLSDGGDRSLTYNGENRLLATAPLSPLEGNERIISTYDYKGRRVKKTVEVYLSGAWSELGTRSFVYDIWNAMRESTSDGATASTTHNVWGLDLSGSTHGAAGTGGLVALAVGGQEQLFAYDGGGNVGQVVAGDQVYASYEYDVFGNIVVTSGPGSGVNPWGFSTRATDRETGLSYYGHRYYDPVFGRWQRRDPIGIAGGPNPYLIVGNRPPNAVDVFGLDTYLLFVGDEDGVPFTDAAELQKERIETNRKFDAECDEAKIVQSRTFDDIQTALKESKDIVEIWFFMHSGPGILYLDTRSTDAASNLTDRGGLHTVPRFLGVFGEEQTFESTSLKHLDTSNIKKAGKARYRLYVKGCLSTKIAAQLGDHFGMHGSGIRGTAYYPRWNGKVTPTGVLGYTFIKLLRLEDPPEPSIEPNATVPLLNGAPHLGAGG